MGKTRQRAVCAKARGQRAVLRARSVNSRNPVGEGRGGGRDRRQKRERPLAPEGPSDASILRKGNH